MAVAMMTPKALYDYEATMTEMLEIQTKLTETTVDMLKPAVDAAYQKGYADAMGWKTQNHLEHLPTQKNA